VEPTDQMHLVPPSKVLKAAGVIGWWLVGVLPSDTVLPMTGGSKVLTEDEAIDHAEAWLGL
jgi:hypothetical protein